MLFRVLGAIYFIKLKEEKPIMTNDYSELKEKRSVRPNKDVSTLCWKCKRVDCSWMRSFKPVKGWVADRYDYKCYYSGNNEYIVDSYVVKECPLFLRNKRLKEI